MEPVLVFRSEPDNWAKARQKAIALGRRFEEEYKNEDDEIVRWRLECVITLDELGDGDLDGVEVFCRFAQPMRDYRFEDVFEAEKIEPGSSGVFDKKRF